MFYFSPVFPLSRPLGPGTAVLTAKDAKSAKKGGDWEGGRKCRMQSAEWTADGAIDNLMIHRAELSPKEVLKHYEAVRSAPAPALAP